MSNVLTNLVPDANPDGGGTDNTAAIQSAIDTALATYQPVSLPPGHYAVYGTLHINPVSNLTFSGSPAGRMGPDDWPRGTWLVWNGPADGTMFDIRGIKCAFTDLAVCSARNTSLGVAFDLEMPDVYPGISSQHLFQNVASYGMIGPVRVGWLIGNDQRPNNEFHWWKDCVTRYNTYAGIHVPNGTFQAKNLVCEGCTFGGSGTFQDYGVVIATGSMDFWKCNFDSLGYAVKWFGGAYEACNFISCTGESNRHYLAAGGCRNVNMIGCRVAMNGAPNPQVAGDEFITGGGNWNIIGNAFEDTTNHFMRPGDGSSVFAAGNQFNTAEPFVADNQSTFRLSSAANRVALSNPLPEGGSYWQRNVPGMAFAGAGLLLSDGYWPLKGTYSGGTYSPGPGENKLFVEGTRTRMSSGGGYSYQLAYGRKLNDVGGGTVRFQPNTDTNHYGNVPPSAVSAPGTHYAYWVTYDDGAAESEPDRFIQQFYTGPVGGPSGAVTLGLPAGPEGTKVRRLYRGGDPNRPDLSALVLTVNDNTTTSVTDVAAAGTAVPPSQGRKLPAAWLVF